jgi:hypothetical protein
MSMGGWEAFVSELENAGYFKYAEHTSLEQAKRAIIASESLFSLDSGTELVGRVFDGDAERLAEGGVLGFLFQISPFLQAQGVSAPVYLDQDFQVGRFAYSVKVNLDEYVMLAEEEYGEVMAWVAVPARAFAMVNKMLERVGSRERVYSTQGSIAQRSLAIFLTPELYDIIRGSNLLSGDEKLMTVDELMELF